MAASLPNTPEMTVTELSGALKRTIEDRFGYVRVRGEITGFRGAHTSGHAYFSLKDSGAKIDAVVWKGQFLKLRSRIQEGLEVIATGKITTFPGKSSYQIVVEAVEPAGAGALMALLEERRRKLAAEGLFDEARRRPLPFLPGVIGVVTSPTGAVIRDILHRLGERFARHVLVWPVRVQGETSAAEVAAAISGFNALAPDGAIPRPDLLIVARGGGSLEDLWSFNEEIVVRAARASQIPLISAIGHETDWTLMDHAADLRAPTPTAAAEKAVPVRLELLGTLADLARRQTSAVLRRAERLRADLRSLARALPGAEDVLAGPRQRLDRAGERLVSACNSAFDQRRIKLAQLSQKLARHSPQAELARARERLRGAALRLGRMRMARPDRLGQQLANACQRLAAAMASRIRLASQQNGTARGQVAVLGQRLARAARNAQTRRLDRLRRLAQVLATLGYRSVLARGFALVRDEAGAPLHSASKAGAAARLEIEFFDGRAAAVPEGKRGAAGRGKGKGEAQGNLF